MLYKYTSQRDDVATGLMYYKSRYYDPGIGRFISADSVVPDPDQSQSFNRFSYGNNNPISYNDPSGHFSVKKVFKQAIKEVTLQGAYNRGGWLNVGLTLGTAGIVNHTNEGGWSVGYCGNVGKSPVILGIRWQEKGFNGGFSVTFGFGYKANYWNAAYLYTYNINKGHSTIGIQAGYGGTGTYTYAGVGYAWTYDRNGQLIGRGAYGYGGLNHEKIVNDTIVAAYTAYGKFMCATIDGAARGYISGGQKLVQTIETVQQAPENIAYKFYDAFQTAVEFQNTVTDISENGILQYMMKKNNENEGENE